MFFFCIDACSLCHTANARLFTVALLNAPAALPWCSADSVQCRGALQVVRDGTRDMMPQFKRTWEALG